MYAEFFFHSRKFIFIYHVSYLYILLRGKNKSLKLGKRLTKSSNARNLFDKFFHNSGNSGIINRKITCFVVYISIIKSIKAFIAFYVVIGTLSHAKIILE